MSAAPFRPELQPQMDAIRGFLAEKGWGTPEFLAAVWGRDANGKPRNSGSIHPLMTGTRAVSPYMAKTIRDAVGLDLSAFVKHDARPYAPREKLPATRAAAAVAAYEREKPTLPSSTPQVIARAAGVAAWASDAPARLAIAITDNGRGNLTFNLVDAPATEVLRALAVLQAAGLAGPPGATPSTAQTEADGD